MIMYYNIIYPTILYYSEPYCTGAAANSPEKGAGRSGTPDGRTNRQRLSPNDLPPREVRIQTHNMWNRCLASRGIRAN